MRRNFVTRTDGVGGHVALGLDSTDRLFADRADLLHIPFAIRFPVVKEGQNYSGHSPRPLHHLRL